MKILAIDSSGLVASCAIWEGDAGTESGKILALGYTDHKKTHSQTLLPMIDRLCADTDSDPKAFDAVAISSGPGSFTGLRIGSATAKGIAQAAGVPIIEVPTLKGLAYNFFGSEKVICPMMDARRDQVYTAAYVFENGRVKELISQRAVSLQDMVSDVNGLGKEAVFLGDGSDAYKEQIVSLVSVPYIFAPANLSRQNAASVAVIAAEMFDEGLFVKAEDHKPEYLRVSQAEREGAKDFGLV